MPRISSVAVWAALLPMWGTALTVAQEPEPSILEEETKATMESKTQSPLTAPVCSAGFFSYVAYPKDKDACVQYCIPRGACEMNLLRTRRLMLFASEPGDCRLKEFIYLNTPDAEDEYIRTFIAARAPLCQNLTVVKYRKTEATPTPEPSPSTPGNTVRNPKWPANKNPKYPAWKAPYWQQPHHVGGQPPQAYRQQPRHVGGLPPQVPQDGLSPRQTPPEEPQVPEDGLSPRQAPLEEPQVPEDGLSPRQAPPEQAQAPAEQRPRWDQSWNSDGRA